MTLLRTFLFTDIQGSTQLWEKYHADMQSALARHDAILREAIYNHNGRIVKTTGDGLMAVFEHAADGLAAALAGQRLLASEPWPAVIGSLRVRMGLHSGESEEREGDFFGPAVNRTARIMSIGHGGQILISSLTAGLTTDKLPPEASLLDLGEHGLRDLAHPEHIFQLCHPAIDLSFPALNSLAAYNHNLPVQLTSFIGRQQELVEVIRLLDQTRLLTLLGPGGTGKTRLMLQAAAELVDQFSEGVWLVELATVTDTDLLVNQVASVLGVRDQPGRQLLDVLADYLRLKQALLLLDNVEHLVAGCAQLAEVLLKRCPNIKILVTGRESLFIGGETTLQVPSLRMPGIGESALETILASEAVQLFTSRAQSTLPDFQLTAQNASAVVEIVRRLDGIPLAIELAAARLRMLSVEQIADRLNDLFRLLTGGRRTALPRQQTLQAMIDWSWNLLEENERILLRRLSVFSGGWTLEAAEAVAGFDGLDTFDGLEQLANKSLVVVDRLETGLQRYHLLESIRQYAGERLFEAGEGKTLRDRHAACFAALIMEAFQQVFGRDMLAWVEKVRLELDNIRAAMAWALESAPELALQMSGRLFTIRTIWFSPSESHRWLEQSIEIGKSMDVAVENTHQHQINLGLALCAFAGINIGLGRQEVGMAASQQAVDVLRPGGATQEFAFALAAKGFALLFTGDWQAAHESSQEAHDMAVDHGYPWVQAMSLSTLAWSEALSGEFSRAQAHLDEATSLAERLENPFFQGQTCMLAGRFFTQKGELELAQGSYEQATLHFADLHDQSMLMVGKSEISHLLRRRGLFDEALPVYRETIHFYQEVGNSAAVAHQLECFAYLAIESGEPERAARLIGAAMALREQGHSESVIPWERDELAQGLARLESMVGTAHREAAMAEGRRMSLDEAVAFARGDN